MRYVWYEHGDPLAALQVVTRDGKHAVIANAYTVPARRRKGSPRLPDGRACRRGAPLIGSPRLAREAWLRTVEPGAGFEPALLLLQSSAWPLGNPGVVQGEGVGPS